MIGAPFGILATGLGAVWLAIAGFVAFAVRRSLRPRRASKGSPDA